MDDQRSVRRTLARLEDQQRRRTELVAEHKQILDSLVAEKQLEIDNLRAQVTIRSVMP